MELAKTSPSSILFGCFLRETLTKSLEGLNDQLLQQLRGRQGLRQGTLIFQTFKSFYDAFLRELKTRIIIVEAEKENNDKGALEHLQMFTYISKTGAGFGYLREGQLLESRLPGGIGTTNPTSCPHLGFHATPETVM